MKYFQYFLIAYLSVFLQKVKQNFLSLSPLSSNFILLAVKTRRLSSFNFYLEFQKNNITKSKIVQKLNNSSLDNKIMVRQYINAMVTFEKFRASIDGNDLTL